MLTRLFLTPAAQAYLERTRVYLCEDRGMGRRTAAWYSFWLGVCFIFFRLEGPAWQSLRRRSAPWFEHLRSRPWRFADPLRYVLQAGWMLLFVSPGEQRGWPAARTIQRFMQAARFWLLRRRRRWFERLGQMTLRMRQDGYGRYVAEHYAALGRGARGLVLLLAGTLACGMALLLVTQPFSYFAQLIFVILLWGTAMVVRRMPSQLSTLMLIVLSVTVSSRYIWWRYTSTLNWSSNLDLVFGLALLLAETYSWIVLLLGYAQTAWPLRRQPASLPEDQSQWPTVDLMIPTYNEDLSVVKPTVYAALGMDWPKDKLRIHILDDGRREAFREFAQQVGVGYIIRPDGRHAKAGNLNHALQYTDGDLVAIFDCDHIPTRSFLQLTTGWFLKDPKLALVQTPHHFFSPDPFERNLGHFGKQPNENALFYGLLQDGNDLWNAAFFCGSCAVLRRSAIEDIGGFAVETVTEDAHTALRLHRKGYNSAYLRIPQAAGLATESLSAHIGQRIRWARGMVQIFRTDNPLLGKGLSFFQRICYLNAMLHFLAGIPRIIYLTAPLAFLWFHSYIVYAPAVAILLNVVPHMVHANITNSHIQGSYRRTFWGEVYETVLAWYIARPTTVALFAPSKGKFNVTAKGGLVERQYFDWTISHPYVLLALANVVGLGFGIWRLFTGPSHEIITVLITMLWVFYNLIILGGAVAVAAEVRQVRQTHRVPASLPAFVQSEDGHILPAVLTDYSEGGVGLTLDEARGLKHGQRITLILARGERRFSFAGTISRSLGRNIGIQFDSLSQQDHIDLIQCTFARADSWLAWSDRFRLDRPLRSLRDVVVLGFSGYQRLAAHAPFPFNVMLRESTNALSWLMSFVPRRNVDAPVSKF